MGVRDGLGDGPTFMTRRFSMGSSRSPWWSPSATRACPSRAPCRLLASG